ncbi:2-amino-4-hydroxy-6-hydroxymethyldihydropteridine diphosphokinase [Litorimonas cladophorae]|nr:2-amino-4-hydroxy-6-hydroxymethyldihydropteridine diphosphokinase [Litorimonas cladophorae]
MTECLIAFGGNLSSPKVTFQIALAMLSTRGFEFTAKSGLWQSPAWPAGKGYPDYLNAVVSGRYSGEPEELMTELLSVEAALGRERSVANAPRTLDLDLLIFGDETRNSDHLILPHPRMLTRSFVLIPASEIDENWLQYADALPEAEVRAMRYVEQW